MIQFSGQLSEKAEKHMYGKSKKMGRIIFTIAWLIICVPIFIYTIAQGETAFVAAFAPTLPIIHLLMCIPKSKKTRQNFMPTKILVNQDSIQFTSKVAQETRYLADVKEVRDYGEFYDVIFRFGKKSEFYICEKDLLSHGTLEAFEELFKGKIVRKDKYTR